MSADQGTALCHSAQDRDSTPPFGRSFPAKGNVSTACFACRRRKTKCTGHHPCAQCMKRGTISDCHIDSTTDLRRKRVSELNLAELQRDRSLLDDLLEAICLREGSGLETLGAMMRTGASKEDVRTYIDTFLRAAPMQSCSRSSSRSESSTSSSLSSLSLSATARAKTINELLN